MFKAITSTYLIASLFVRDFTVIYCNQWPGVTTLKVPLLTNITHPKYSRQRRSSDVPSALNRRIDNVLQHMHMANRKRVGEGVELECAGKLTKEFMSDFPQATFRWLFNNEPFILRPDRMLYRNNAIVMQSLTTDDSGLYVCQMEYARNRHKTLAFHSLLVISLGSTAGIKQFQSFKLQCASQFIGKLHRNSYRNWLFNGKVNKEFSKIPATQITPEVIPRIEKGHSGTWTCEVIEPTNGKKWELKFYRIHVGLPLTWVTGIDVHQFIPTGKKKTILIAVGVVIVILLLILGMIIVGATRQGDKQQEALNQIKSQLIRIKAKGIKLRGQKGAGRGRRGGSSGSSLSSDSGSES